MAKISIIIPVYNDEKYITETLDSIIAQTFTDWDAVCIDDGSTDNSLNILKKYASKNKKIRVIHQENSGVIAARTNGIKNTKSEFIYMLDGDDKIAPTTLEQMYKEIQKPRRDIITSRVMRFGMESGEMKLLKPNKLNMSNHNCLVNAALMRRKDFLECGGFDPRFKYMLEDYDLWLNLLYNHNKKIYRIPKILFFYRIKPKALSRNFKSRNTEYTKTVMLLKAKYPIRKWHKLSNILSYPLHFAKFFIRTQGNHIRFFKLLTCKIRKYDVFMSVGAACFVPDVLKELKLRDFSGPFDWMYGADILTRLNLIKNGFKDYFNFADFEYTGINPDNGKAIYKNTRTGIVYNHDFPNDDFDVVFPDIKEKYNRRTKRILNHLSKPKNILFVYSELGQTGDKEKIAQAINDINKTYIANIDLLYINHNKEIPLNRFFEPKLIAPHLFYAEYHYEKFPDELLQARAILTHILKRFKHWPHIKTYKETRLKEIKVK